MSAIRVFRSVSLALLLATVACVLHGCSGGHPMFVLIPTTTGLPLWDAVHTGALEGARQCGRRVLYDAPPREDDLPGQLALFLRYTRSGDAGIILSPVQAQALRNPVQQALSRDVNVVVLNDDLGIRHLHLAYVFTDDEAGGRLAARQAGTMLHGQGTVGLVGVDPRQKRSLVREQAFESELHAGFPRIQIIGRLSGTPSLLSEQQEVLQFMDASRPSALIALTSEATRATYLAAHSFRAERHAERVPRVIGFDQNMIDSVRNGEISALIAAPADSLGRVSAHLLCELSMHHAVPIRTVLPPILITADTIDSPAVSGEVNRSWWRYE